jgi:hypothetical protein
MSQVLAEVLLPRRTRAGELRFGVVLGVVPPGPLETLLASALFVDLPAVREGVVRRRIAAGPAE